MTHKVIEVESLKSIISANDPMEQFQAMYRLACTASDAVYLPVAYMLRLADALSSKADILCKHRNYAEAMLYNAAAACCDAVVAHSPAVL